MAARARRLHHNNNAGIFISVKYVWEMGIFADGFSFVSLSGKYFAFERVKLHFQRSSAIKWQTICVRRMRATAKNLIGKSESNRSHGICVVFANLELYSIELYIYVSKSISWFALNFLPSRTLGMQNERSRTPAAMCLIFITLNHVPGAK